MTLVRDAECGYFSVAINLMRLPRTSIMVVASILIHIGILVGLGSLVYVFTVQYPESVGKREKARKEAEWLQSAVEEIQNSDGTTESLIRIKLPDSILREATNAITAPTLSLPPQTNDLSRATASP